MSSIEPPAYRPVDPSGHFVAFVHDKKDVISTRDAYDHWFGLATGERPRQAHLDALFAVANRVVVKATGQSRGRALGTEVVVDTRDQRSLRELASALQIQEIPEDRHCACLGGPVLELFADERELASIGCQHGHAIRWRRWLPDAPLVNVTLLDAWLRGEGIHPDLLRRLYNNRYDQNGLTKVGYQRPGARPLTLAEQRVRLLELQRHEGFDEVEMFGKLNEELAADPTLALAYVVRGKLHHQLGRADECVEDLASARRYGIEDALVMCERAVALHRLGRIDEAIADCSAAIELTPAYPPAWNSRGLLLLERDRVTEAISDLDRAVALAPDWIWPVLNRARAYQTLGDRRQAREDAGRASALLPSTVHPADAGETAARRMIDELLS
jgi:tetratricopeptide (TPR) repeat protein